MLCDSIATIELEDDIEQTIVKQDAFVGNYGPDIEPEATRVDARRVGTGHRRFLRRMP